MINLVVTITKEISICQSLKGFLVAKWKSIVLDSAKRNQALNFNKYNLNNYTKNCYKYLLENI